MGRSYTAKMKSLAGTTLLLISLSSASAQAAGGAFAVDDAAVESAGVCKVETIAAHGLASNRDRFAVSTPACSVAVGTHRSEFAVGVGRRYGNGTYATPTLVKFKTPVPDLDFASNDKWGAAFSAGLIADLDGERRSGYFVTLPASYKIGGILLNANIGRTEFDNRSESFTSWGASIELNLKSFGYDQVTLVAETFSPKRAETANQIGARYIFSPRVDIDLLFGRNLGGERKHWLTFGLTQRF